LAARSGSSRNRATREISPSPSSKPVGVGPGWRRCGTEARRAWCSAPRTERRDVPSKHDVGAWRTPCTRAFWGLWQVSNHFSTAGSRSIHPSGVKRPEAATPSVAARTPGIQIATPTQTPSTSPA
jgi:hypothetical protein